MTVRTWEDKFLHARVAGTEETVQFEMLRIADEQTSNQQQNSLRSKTKHAACYKSSTFSQQPRDNTTHVTAKRCEQHEAIAAILTFYRNKNNSYDEEQT